ncbi:MAG: hypothetical protein ACPG4T_04885 [Nannocystaceae bacterium]
MTKLPAICLREATGNTAEVYPRRVLWSDRCPCLGVAVAGLDIREVVGRGEDSS